MYSKVWTILVFKTKGYIIVESRNQTSTLYDLQDNIEKNKLIHI